MQRLTKEQAALIGLYTGITFGPFSDIQELADKLLGRTTITTDFASQALFDELQSLAKPLLQDLFYKPDPENPS